MSLPEAPASSAPASCAACCGKARDRVVVLDNFLTGPRRKSRGSSRHRSSCGTRTYGVTKRSRPFSRAPTCVSRSGHSFGAAFHRRSACLRTKSISTALSTCCARRRRAACGAWCMQLPRPLMETRKCCRRSRPCRRGRSRPTRCKSWWANTMRRSSRRPSASRLSRCATSTSTARARTLPASTPACCRCSSRPSSSGAPPTIFGDGEQSRDFTYVEDVVELEFEGRPRARRFRRTV